MRLDCDHHIAESIVGLYCVIVSNAVNKAQTIGQYQAARPVIGQDVFVAPNSSVIGDVNLGNGSSIWYGAILRGNSFTEPFILY